MKKNFANITRNAQSGYSRLLCFSLLFILVLDGCATYASRIRVPRQYFEYGEYELAVEELERLVAIADNDQLLYLMDLGLVYHSMGKYKEAIQTFLKADKLAEIKDYTSLTEESASILLSDEVKPYKGEDFEKILINVYLAIDYTLLGQWDDALVECRRVNHKLDLMISQGKLPYEQNAFAKYLAAALFEARREYNDAFVDYRQVQKWFKHLEFPYLGGSLLRVADKLKFSQEFEEYRKKYPQINGFRMNKNEGEIVLLLEQGKTPIKVPHPNFSLLPKFQRRSYSGDYAWLRLLDNGLRARTYRLYDIEETAIRELDHRTGLIIAKKVGGLVVKEVAAYAVEKATKSELAGALTKIALYLSDQADLRSWTTLPASLQLARLTVPSGRHDVVLDMVVFGGQEIPGIRRWEQVEVKPGQIVFLNYRLMD